MRPQKVLDIDMITKLTEVFRERGYEGTSLAEIAKATGLKKASLYHRFPNGKQEMAEAVLTHVDEWVETHIFKVLLDESRTPEERLVAGLDSIRNFYNNGEQVCVFRALSMKSGLELFQIQIENGMKRWIEVFEIVGKTFQISPSKAKEEAIQTLVEIQGSLILVKGLSDLKIFENTLQKIRNRYITV